MDELNPIYRIEFFLDAIVNSTTPPKPIYRVEFYLAKIAGADVEISEPVYRMEKYLAYLCGEEVELPDPIYRIEYYLAFLCGLNVELPEPIYRVEFWLWDWCGGGGIEKTIIGNPIHILDALAKPAQALSVKLEPIQDLHGYDNPWPAGGGINLLPPYSLPSVTDQGVTLTNNNGEYILNGTASPGVAVFDVRVDLPAGQYTVALNNPTVNSNVQIYGVDENVAVPLQVQCTTANTTATATFAATVKIFRIRVLINGTVDNFKLSPVFSAGATAATQFYPYSNICPISGHTDADVIVSPTLNQSDGTTYPIPLGQTVYGGTLDVVTGVLTVDRVLDTITKDSAWYSFSTGTGNSSAVVQLTEYLNCKFVSGISSYNGAISSTGVEEVNYWTSGRPNEVPAKGDMCFAYSAGGQLRFHRTDVANITDLASFKANFPDTQIVYYLATPTTIQLTPTQVELLQGENNLFSDGTMTLVYLADGNASDEEALNILLGGRYVNNHGEDEPTDREALDIVLGGKK